MQTRGELVFAEYLESYGLTFEFERQHAGKVKRPDFTVMWDRRDCLFDVKDREGDDIVYVDPLSDDASADDDEPIPIAPDPHRWIREQIEQGRRKFKEFKGSVCAIVLFPANGWGHELEEPDFVLGAMYGDYGIAIPWNAATERFDGEPESRFLDHGKMIRPKWKVPQNTTISALITLRDVRVGAARLHKHLDKTVPRDQFWWDPQIQSKVDFDIAERHTGAIVWENAFAATPFPCDLFRGPYDERWGRHGSVVTKLHEGDLLRNVKAVLE
jgi:hypothetical protein